LDTRRGAEPRAPPPARLLQAVLLLLARIAQHAGLPDLKKMKELDRRHY